MNKPKQSGLGKGLSALMGEGQPAAGSAYITSTPSQTSGQAELPLTALRPGKYQPRVNFRLEQLQELADSITHNGIMQPILVRPTDEDGMYEIIAGERRFRAAKLADLDRVPVLIREMSDKVALELGLVENIQRADLSPIEEALGYQRLIEEFDYTQEELSETIGKSRSHVTNLLRLLNLPVEVKEMLDKDELSMGHARALLGTENPVQLAEEVVRKGLSVRQTEALTRRDPNKPVGRPRKGKSAGQGAVTTLNRSHYGPKDPDIVALEETLSENLGLKVGIFDQGNSGEITIEYNTLEQLDDVLRRLGGGI